MATPANELDNIGLDVSREPEVEADPVANVLTGKRRCPNCGWTDVRPSHIRGPVDFVFSFFSVRPFRCRSCANRFRRWSKAA